MNVYLDYLGLDTFNYAVRIWHSANATDFDTIYPNPSGVIVKKTDTVAVIPVKKDTMEMGVPVPLPVGTEAKNSMVRRTNILISVYVNELIPPPNPTFAAILLDSNTRLNPQSVYFKYTDNMLKNYNVKFTSSNGSVVGFIPHLITRYNISAMALPKTGPVGPVSTIIITDDICQVYTLDVTADNMVVVIKTESGGRGVCAGQLHRT